MAVIASFEMRKVLFLCISFLVLYSCGHDKHRKIVVEDSGGVFREEYYVINDTIKDGKYLRFFVGGKLSDSCNYKMGKLDGIRKLYSDDGNLEIVETYKNGKLNGDYIVYYPNGKVKIKQKFVDNKIQGISYKYFLNGNMQEEVTMKNGMENGAFKEYYDNGNLHWKGFFVEGPNEQDTLYEYSKNGDLIRKLFCKIGYCRTVWRIKEGYVKLDPKLQMDDYKLKKIVDIQNQ